MSLCHSFFLFLSIVATGFSSDDRVSSYINNKVPESNKQFPVFWNIPTFQCASHNINFTNLAKKYGITQNSGDKFRGNEIAILYDPGAFPAILKSKESGKIYLRNGGIPQNGNLNFHLNIFKETVDQLISNKNFTGLGIIDFESWRPIFRQNFGTLAPYKELSINELKKIHPFWPEKVLEKEAARLFEFSAEIFMKETILLATRLRPKASWGYYHYPYCFNMSPNSKRKNCPPEVTSENDRINLWLFRNVDNLYPSLYVSETTMNLTERVQMVLGRVKESQRIISKGSWKKPSKTYPYFWYKYQDTKNFLGKKDLYELIKTLTSLNIDGLILWGSSNDVNSKQNCEELYKYIEFVLGPAILNR